MSLHNHFDQLLLSDSYKSTLVDTVFTELSTVYTDFESRDLRFRLKQAKSFVFAIDTIAQNYPVSSKDIEMLLVYLDKVKSLFYDKFFWNRTLGNLYKKMFELNSWKRTVISTQKYKVETETALVIFTTQSQAIIEDLSDANLGAFKNLVFCQTGYDGDYRVEVEMINLPKPILDVKDYKKEMITMSEFIPMSINEPMVLSAGYEIDPKNIVSIELGDYLVAMYQFETKIKIVVSKIDKR